MRVPFCLQILELKSYDMEQLLVRLANLQNLLGSAA